MMNKQIFELAKQADLIQWNTLPSGAITPDHISVVKAKRFAELIAQECARIAEESDTSWTGAGPEAAAQIREQFGVE